MDEMEKYLFDLNGYLVIEEVLDASELAVLNGIVDSLEIPADSLRVSYAGGRHTRPGFLDWGQPFVDLLDHPAVMQVLRFRLGDCFRLDRLYSIVMSPGQPMGRLHSDYGASAPQAASVPGEYYSFPPNEVHSGFVVVSWNLTDSGPEHGGFCCLPGSHKSNYRLPRQIAEEGEDSPHVAIPEAPAGSVTLFTEALTHGTSAWRGPHQRRTLLFKYCVSQMAWGSGRVRPPEGCELTPRQRQLLAEPADPHRFFPSLFEEEETTA